MAINKRLLVKPPSTGITPSEHFGVALYEGDGSSSHSINGGKFGAAAYTANSGVVTLPDNVIDVDNHSVSIWFYANNLSGEQHLMEFDETNRIIFRISSPNNNDWCYVGNSGYFDHGLRFNTGQWYHIVITFSNGNPFKIYRNGSLEYTGGNTSLFANNSNNDVGAGSSTGGANVEGKIDQLRIFHKELSSSEVSTLYAETVETVESLDPLSEDTTDTLQVLGDSSCVATYRFENDEDDLSGNYDGTGTEIQYAAGRYGQAASFNGSTSRVLNSSFTAITGNAARTYNVWAYTNGSTSGALVCTGQWGVGGRSIALYIDQSINRFKAYGYTSSYDTDLGTLPTLSNGWHMFSLSWDGSSIYKAYIDGVLISTTTKNATFNTTSYLCIGDWYDATVGVYHYGNKILVYPVFL